MENSDESKQKAIAQAMQSKRLLPFRIHYIFTRKETPDFWEANAAYTMRQANTIVRKGGKVEVLS